MELNGGRDLYLAGTGSFAREVAEWAEDTGWRVAGLVELVDEARVGTLVGGHSVVAATALPAGSATVIAAGGDRSVHHASLAAARWRAATVVHPRAHVSSSAVIAPGCIVAPGAVIGAEAHLGEHTLVSRGALVGHHARTGRFVSLLPGANLGGNAAVGDRSVVAMGAVIVNSTTVGEDVTVAAGAVVVRDVHDSARVQGVPAKEYPA